MKKPKGIRANDHTGLAQLIRNAIPGQETALEVVREIADVAGQPGYDPAALDRFAEAGRIAWRDVPDAAEWVRRLRGGN